MKKTSYRVIIRLQIVCTFLLTLRVDPRRTREGVFIIVTAYGSELGEFKEVKQLFRTCELYFSSGNRN